MNNKSTHGYLIKRLKNRKVDLHEDWLDFDNFDRWINSHSYPSKNELVLNSTLLDIHNKQVGPIKTILLDRDVSIQLNGKIRSLLNLKGQTVPWIGVKKVAFKGQEYYVGNISLYTKIHRSERYTKIRPAAMYCYELLNEFMEEYIPYMPRHVKNTVTEFIRSIHPDSFIDRFETDEERRRLMSNY